MSWEGKVAPGDFPVSSKAGRNAMETQGSCWHWCALGKRQVHQSPGGHNGAEQTTVHLLQASFPPSEDMYFGSYETLRYLSREMEGGLCERAELAERQEKAG